MWSAAVTGDAIDPARASRAFAYALASTIRGGTNTFKLGARKQMIDAGLGRRLPNAFRAKVTDGDGGSNITRRGGSLDPVGEAKSTAIKKTPRGPVDLIGVFLTGAVIRALGGSWLAIPTQHAVKGKGPREYSDGSLTPRNVRGSRSRAVLVYRGDGRVHFVLQPTVTLRKRLNFDPIYRRVTRGMPRSFERNLTRMRDLFIRESA